MATLYDVIGTREPRGFAKRKNKKPKKELSIGRAVWGFFVLSSVHVILAGVLYYFDPTLFDLPTDRLATPGNRTNLCAKVFVFLPQSWETLTVCRISNIIPFVLMPGLVLFYILGRLVRGR